MVTFTDTVTTQSLSIDIVDDLVFEPTEHFNISLSTSSDGCNIPPGNAIVPVYVVDDGEILHNTHCMHEYNKLQWYASGDLAVAYVPNSRSNSAETIAG